MTAAWLLWRYVAQRFATYCALGMAGVLSLVYLIECIENLRRFGSTAGLSGVLALSAFRLPWLFEQVLPFIVLLSAMATFIGLTRSFELVVARASGFSAWQFLAPTCAAAALLGVVATVAVNPLASSLINRYGDTASILRNEQSLPARPAWLRQRGDDGQSVMLARRILEDGRRLSGVSVFEFAEDGAFERRIEAETALLDRGLWRLENAWVLAPETGPVFESELTVSTQLSPTEARESLIGREQLSFWQLPRFIAIARDAGLNTAALSVQWHTLLARPLMLVAMVVLAATVSLKVFRFGNIRQMILSGVAAGFLVYVFSQMAGDIGEAGLVGAAVAAWMPACVVLALGATVLLVQEDG